MKIIVYIEHGCLGSAGERYVRPFCHHFSNFLQRQLGYMKLDIVAVPREPNDPEFRYIDNNTKDVDNTAITSSMRKFNLSRAEFEDELTKMAVGYAASPEWQSLVPTAKTN